MVTRPSSSCSAREQPRHSSVSGLRHRAAERAGVQVAGRAAEVDLAVGQAAHAGARRSDVSRDHMPVSETTTTSQASRSGAPAAASAKCGEPDSSSPSTISLRLTAGLVAAGRRQVGAQAERVEADLALVVGGAAGVAAGRRRIGRLERRVLPQVQRRDRLDVVVAVDEQRSARLGRRSATRRRPPAGRRSPRPRRSGSRWRARPARGTRPTGVRRRRAPGRRRSTGCAATRPGSRDEVARRRRRPPHGRRRSGRWRRCRGSCAEPYGPARAVADRRLASARCAWRPSTCSRPVADRRPGRRGRPRGTRRRALDADVVGLQEVDRAQPGRTGVDQTAAGGRRRSGAAMGGSSRPSHGTPGGDAVDAPSTRRRRRDCSNGPAYGVGLVSRLPVPSWRVRRFGAGAGRRCR